MYCRQCGKEISDESEFCGHCGAPVDAAAPPGGPAGQPPSTPAGTAEPGPASPPSGKSLLPWVLGSIGVLAVIAIVLVLVFVVFKGDGASETSGPEQVVETFYQALEKQDVDVLIGAMEPSFRSELEDALGKDYDRFLEDYFLAHFPEDMEVDIRKMETKVDGDKATVTVVDGSVTYTDENGKKVSEEASEGDAEPVQLVRVDGKWYLSGEYLKESGFDPEELAALAEDEEDLQDGTGTGDQDGADEMAEVEEAMLAFAKENSAEGVELFIIGLLIKGDEAVGVAFCPGMELEDVPIVMEKGSSGWKGVDFGTGIELPAWFEAELAEVEEAMLAYTKEHAMEGIEFEIENLMIRGDEACAIAVPTNFETDAPLVTMRKGPDGWYGVEVGTGGEVPSWYETYLFGPPTEGP